MTIKIGINGYGRIGRNVLRAAYEGGRKDVRIVAVNDLGPVQTNAHLTRHDTVHGRFPGTVEVDGEDILVNGDRVRVLAEREPGRLPWGKLGIDVVLECTGVFTTRDKASLHLKAGAGKVLIAQPAGADVKTVVYGVNHAGIEAGDDIVSNASCTTNCLAPLVKPIQDSIGIVSGLMTTIHSFTNDQVLIDVFHKDLRRARAATHSQIPTKTGAAAAVGLVLPEMKGKLDGFAVRVPTINVSMVDLTFVPARDTSVEEIHRVMREAAQGELKGVLKYSDEPLVSSDFNHDPASSIFDSTLTRIIGKRLIKVCAWYDNEWGFSNRMLDVGVAMGNAK